MEKITLQIDPDQSKFIAGQLRADLSGGPESIEDVVMFEALLNCMRKLVGHAVRKGRSLTLTNGQAAALHIHFSDNQPENEYIRNSVRMVLDQIYQQIASRWPEIVN